MKCRFFLTFYLRNLEQTGLDMIKAGTEVGWNIWVFQPHEIGKPTFSKCCFFYGLDSAAIFF